MLTTFCTKLISMSLMGIIAILSTSLFKKFLSQRLSPKAHLYIWIPVLFRLIVPHSFSTRASIYNYVPQPEFTEVNFSFVQQIGNTQSLQQTNSTHTNINYLFIIWLIGAVISLMIPVVSYLKFKKSLVSSNFDLSSVDGISYEASKICGIKKVPRIFVCKNAFSPMIAGIFKPYVIIPEHILKEFSKQQLIIVFVHEYTHLKRMDRFINLLLMLCCAFHWFNPFVWIVSRQIRHDLENVCDEVSMSYLDDSSRSIYGNTILDIIECSNSIFVNSFSSTMANSKKTLRTRIKTLCSYGKKKLQIIALPFALIISTTMLTGAVGKKTDTAAEFISENISNIANDVLISSYNTDADNTNSDNNTIEKASKSDVTNVVNHNKEPGEILSDSESTRHNDEANHEQSNSDKNNNTFQKENEYSALETNNEENEQINIETSHTSPESSNENRNSNNTTTSNLSSSETNETPTLPNTSASKVYTYSSDDFIGKFSTDKSSSGFACDNGYIQIETVGLISSSESGLSGYFNVYRDGELIGESIRASVGASPNSISFNQTVGNEFDYSFAVSNRTIEQ